MKYHAHFPLSQASRRGAFPHPLRPRPAPPRPKPATDLEIRLCRSGLSEFLAYFQPGELARLLNSRVRAEDCEEIREFLAPAAGTLTLREAMDLSPGLEKTSLTDHVVAIFCSLKMIGDAATQSEAALSAALGKRGLPGDSADLARGGTPYFRQYAEILGYVSRPENRRFFRAFLAGLLFHDIGKIIKPIAHSQNGAALIGRLPEFRAVFKPDELRFIRYLVLHHSLFGDETVNQEAGTHVYRDLISTYEDKKMRDLLVRCLYLTSIADSDATGRAGKLSLPKLRELKKAYELVLFAQGTRDIEDQLLEYGWDSESKGLRRWNCWVIKRKDEAGALEESQLAQIELGRYLQLVYGPDSVPAKIPEFFSWLGSLWNVRKANNRIAMFEDVALRARLVIWLVEYSRRLPEGSTVSFELAWRERYPERAAAEKAVLTDLLTEFDLDKIDRRMTLRYDEEWNLHEIFLQNPTSQPPKIA